jgi:hypothetical protein
VNAPNNTHTNHPLSGLRNLLNDRLATLRNRRRLVLTMSGLAFLFLLISLLTGIETLAWLSGSQKTLSLGGIIILTTVFLLYLHRRYATSSYNSLPTLIHEFTAEYPEFVTLRYLFDLSDHPDSATDQGTDFRKLAIRSNLESIDISQLKQALQSFTEDRPISRLYRQTRHLLAGSACIMLGVSFFFGDATLRTLQFWHSFERPNPYRFTVTPGNSVQEHGQPFTVSVTYQDLIPERSRLYLKTDGEDSYRELVLSTADSLNRSTSRPITLTSDAEYYLSMDEYDSPRYALDIQQRPRFRDLAVSVDPPAYTRRETVSKTYPFADLEAPEGSTIRIRGTLNKPLQQLQLWHLQGSGMTDTLHLKADTALQMETTLTLSDISADTPQQDTLRFAMQDASGLTNELTYALSIRIQPDSYPDVMLLRPDPVVERSKADTLGLTWSASDDYGLTRLRLRYYISSAFGGDSTDLRSIPLSLNRGSRSARNGMLWQMDSLNLKPRDKVTYFLTAWDNDAVSGYKAASSPKFTFRVQSLADYMTDLDNQSKEVESDLESAESAHDSLDQQYEQFRQSIIRQEQDEWSQQQSIEQIKDQRKSIEKKVDEINKKFEDLKKDLESQSMVDDETMKQYEELQKLMKEIDDPEIMKQLEKLQQSLDEFSQQQMREALDKLKFDENAYKERLKRTVELFKRLKLNSELGQLAKGLETLSEQQKELQQKSQSDSTSQSQLQENQQQIAQDWEQLKQRIDSLDSEAPERMKQQMQQLKESLKPTTDSLSRSMQQMKEQLQQGGQSPQQRQQMQQRQQQMARQMNQTAQQLRDAQQQMNQRQQQINMAALRQVLQNLLLLTDSQEDLIRRTEVTQNNSSRFVDLARDEQQIDRQFTTWSDSLSAIAAEVPQLNNRIVRTKQQVEQSLNQSVTQLSERSRSQSTYAQRQVLGGMNTINSLLIDVIDQLMRQQQQGGGSGGSMSMQQMMQQLQQMGGQQQQLNQRLQQMINDMQGEKLTRSAMDRLNQLAKQQQRIKQQLRDLQRRGGMNGEGTDKIMSELERMAEEMDDTIRDLRGGSTDETLVKRQQNILSRMLQAEQALQERGESKKRRGETAQDYTRPDAPQTTLEQLRQELRKRLNDPNLTPYNPEYQRLIERYFELLNNN